MIQTESKTSSELVGLKIVTVNKTTNERKENLLRVSGVSTTSGIRTNFLELTRDGIYRIESEPALLFETFQDASEWIQTDNRLVAYFESKKNAYDISFEPVNLPAGNSFNVVWIVPECPMTSHVAKNITIYVDLDNLTRCLGTFYTEDVLEANHEIFSRPVAKSAYPLADILNNKYFKNRG